MSAAMSSEWQKVQDAATAHNQADGHSRWFATRTLDGLAVGITCRECDESWWRPGYCPHGEYVAQCDLCAVVGEVE